MAKFTSYRHGQFCWIDLMSRDYAAAVDFYGKLFGWECRDQDTQGGPPYGIFQLDGQQVAGLGQMNSEMAAAGMPPVWNSYLNVEDLAATVQRASELGATVTMPPYKILEAGHMAMVQDPTGAMIAFWQKIQHFGAALTNVPNTWVWNELMTDDVEAASDFYGQLLGWTFTQEQTPTGPYWNASVAGRMNNGMLQISPEMGSMPSCWWVYFAVADVDAATAQVRQLGGQIHRPPFEVGVGRLAVVADPQGATFNVIQMSIPVDE